MKYITGTTAFCIPCDLNSPCKWNATKKDFENITLAESDDSVLKDYGIETDKIIPYHPDEELYNVANHVRAYLDLLLNGDYETLASIECSPDVRFEMFKQVRRLLARNDIPTVAYIGIDNFMQETYGSLWRSFGEAM